MDMNQAGAELLQLIKSGLVKGGEVVQAQFPILCEQILRWGMVNNIFTIILSLVIFLISWKVLAFINKKMQGKDYLDRPGLGMLSIAIMITAIIFFIIFWFSIFEIGKILSAPNLYILDYVKSLVTPAK